MSKSPAFQFYPADWLSSSRIAVMTPEQEGIYIRLLCYCWGSGDFSLPDDDEQLLLLSRYSKGGSTNALPQVKACFIPHPEKPGFLTHERLLKEAKKQKAWREKSSIGGRKSVETKRKSRGGSKCFEPNVNTSSSSSSSSSESITENFEKFFTAYPRREGSNPKKPASDKFHQLVKGGTDPREIIAGAEAYALSCKAEGKIGTSFVAQAKTWLTQERWKDKQDYSKKEVKPWSPF